MGNDKLKLVLPISFMIFLSIISPQTVVSEENGSSGYPIIIHHSLQEGVNLEDSISFPVYIENEAKPDLVHWELHSGVESVLFQDVSDSIFLFDGNQSRSVWTFEISIEAESFSPCSCILSIIAQESGFEPIQHYQSIFITQNAEGSGSSEILPPTVYFPDNILDNWAKGMQSFNGISSTHSGSTPEISYTLKRSSDIRCDNYENVLSALDLQRNYPDVVWDSEEFSIPIDVSESPDGWVDVIVSSRDLVSAFEAIYCFPIRVDNNPPTSKIEGPIHAYESMTPSTFYVSNTTDHYWGIGGITYIWSVYEVLDNYNKYVMVESGSNVRSITIDTNDSNTYLISLTAIDNAGNSNTDLLNFDVDNQLPIARLLIDGEPVYDGDEISISKDHTIYIDASMSSDTQNDQHSLRYVWRIDNVPVYEGENRDLSWPTDVEGEFLLSLEVIDDNSASSMISIRVVDSNSVVSPPFVLIGFVLSCLFLVYAASKRSTQNKNFSDIPKWD